MGGLSLSGCTRPTAACPWRSDHPSSCSPPHWKHSQRVPIRIGRRAGRAWATALAVRNRHRRPGFGASAARWPGGPGSGTSRWTSNTPASRPNTSCKTGIPSSPLPSTPSSSTAPSRSSARAFARPERTRSWRDGSKPPRTPRPHSHLESDQPPPRTARVREPPQHPPTPPSSTTTCSPHTHHRPKPTDTPRHTPTRPTRRHRPRIPTRSLTCIDGIIGRRTHSRRSRKPCRLQDPGTLSPNSDGELTVATAIQGGLDIFRWIPGILSTLPRADPGRQAGLPRG